MKGIFGPYSSKDGGEIMHWRKECPHYEPGKFIITTKEPEVKNLCPICRTLDELDEKKISSQETSS